MAQKGWGPTSRGDHSGPAAHESSGGAEPVRQQDNADKSPSSVIGADITVTGDIEATVDLLVEGRVKGDVRCQTLILGSSSSITGNIFAERVRVSGEVEGAIEARDVAVEATGIVRGDIKYARIRVANGATMDGSLKCNREADSKLKLVEPAAEDPVIVIE